MAIAKSRSRARNALESIPAFTAPAGAPAPLAMARKETGISPAQAAATGITQPGALTAPYTTSEAITEGTRGYATLVAGSGVGGVTSRGSSMLCE